MEPQPVIVTRRLAAILAADAANFSRLVAQDEERTLRALAAHRAVIDGTVRSHGGRIVTTAGDSVLAEFASPVQAVRAALEIQRRLRLRDAEFGLPSPMLFRIGVNVGDVVVEGDDILGDDVNVAVRLEGIAPPGGIYVAASVREHVLGKVDARLRDLGTQFLKNIPRPVRVFEVVADVPPAASAPEPAWRARSRLVSAVAAGVLVLLLGSWLSLYNPIAERSLVDGGAHAAGAAASPEERTFWDEVRQTSDPAQLHAYLDRFPAGAFSAIAQARLDGLLAARKRAEDPETFAKTTEALQARAEALRLRGEAEAAAARAAAEQQTAVRLEEQARAAAERAAAAARAAAEAQQRIGRSDLAALAAPAPALQDTGALDGYWTADWNCQASHEGPASFLRLPAVIRYREIRIEAGQIGLPGALRAYGKVAADGGFRLEGTHFPRNERIIGAEDQLQVWGRVEGERLEGAGTIGKRRCSVALTRSELP